MRRDLILKLMCLAALVAISVSFFQKAGEAEEQSKPGIFDWIEEDPLKGDDELFKQFEMELRNEIGMTTPDVKEEYAVAKERAAKGDLAQKFKGYQDEFARVLAERMGQAGATKDELREIAPMLYNDGYHELALPLLQALRLRLTHSERYRAEDVPSRDSEGRVLRRTRELPRDDYKQLCKILGLVEYTYPEDEFNDYYVWELPEYAAWDRMFRELTDGDGRDRFLEQSEFDALMLVHNKLANTGKALRDQDAKDGYAIMARKAYLRFKSENRDTSKRAMFSPKALGREGEKFEDVWGYTYWRPFVVFVEKAPGRDVEDLRKSFADTANLLKQEEAWFRKNFIEPFGLKRVLPIEGPTTAVEGPLKGKKFETPGELAEAEGWPLEILIFKDGPTFQQILDDQIGGSIPGARAYYSNPLKYVLTWDYTGIDEGDETAWFGKSVLIHEAFHMLTDHYAANPIEWEWRYRERNALGVRKRDWFPKVNKPRMFNLLVLEGLADAVAGFKQEGDGENATYSFLTRNRVRIPDWQQTYKALGNNNLFRIQDLLQCVHYGHLGSVGNACWKRIGMDKKKGAFPDPNLYFGVYFCDACMASSFFYEYEENGKPKYRDKWLAYLKADYTGAVDRGDYSPDAGVKAFKDAFGIATDDDFDKIEAELVAWAVALKADD